jgi:DNA repair protein RadC
LDEALSSRAVAVVLSHNHPGGTPEPSQGDVAATRLAVRALSKVGVWVLDHVIVADGLALSMRAAGSLDESEFLGQSPGERLLLSWLG